MDNIDIVKKLEDLYIKDTTDYATGELIKQAITEIKYLRIITEMNRSRQRQSFNHE